VDRQRGKAIFISLWESEQAMKSSEQMMRPLHAELSEALFGFPRLRGLVAKHGQERSLEEALLKELYTFVGEGWEQEDDITLLTLRRSAP
jgi:hypothetical protein